MTNYPPGVTGSEPEIAGWPYEREEHRECSNTDAVIRVIRLDDWINLKTYGAQGNLLDPDRVTVPHCPFVGYVTVYGDHTMRHWSCPYCGTDYEEEP